MPNQTAAGQPRVLVLGGGFGGMFASRLLKGLSPGHMCVELVDHHNYFVFQPLLPEVVSGGLNPADAVTPFRLLLPGVKINEAEVVGIDLEARRVEIVHSMRRRVRSVPWDHLVIALGTRVDLSRFPGLAEHAFLMKDLADAFRLRNHIIDCLEQADITEDAELKRRLLTFVVIGGGLSGVETMGEIEGMIARALPYYPRIRRDEFRLVLAEHAPAILAELVPPLAEYATSALGRRGVEVVTGAGVKSAARDSVELADGRIIHAATLVATIGNAPHPLVAALPLATEKGRLKVRPTLQVEGRDDVWAIGDCAFIPQENGNLAPPTAQAAVGEAKVLAGNIAKVIDGRAPDRFVYRTRGQLASLGARRGVADVMGRQITGFPAWVLWRSAYLSMLPGKAFKLRVGLDWMLDWLIPRNLVQFSPGRHHAIRRARFRAGDVVYRQGDWAGPVYVVESGAFQREPGYDSPTIVGPGNLFGEACVEGERLRRNTVRAVKDSECLVVDSGDFATIAALAPHAGRKTG